MNYLIIKITIVTHEAWLDNVYLECVIREYIDDLMLQSSCNNVKKCRERK